MKSKKQQRKATRVPFKGLIGIQAYVARKLGKSTTLVSLVASGKKKSKVVEAALVQETYRRIRRLQRVA